MLIVHTHGSPYDRGRQYGRQLGPHVRRRAPAQPLQPLAPAGEADRIAANMLRNLDTHEPALLDEMRGLAAGAELPFEAVFHLNVASFVRYILDFSTADREVLREGEDGVFAEPRAAEAGCTNVAFAQTDVGPLLGKTNDGGAPVPPEAQAATWVLQRAEPSAGPPFFIFAPVGALSGVAGMNADGFAIGQSAAQVAPDQEGYGVPSNLMLRPLLERCATVTQALDVLDRRVMAGKGLNLMLLDAAGDVRAAEQSGWRLGVRAPDKSGALYFSNHCHTPELRDLPPRRDRDNSRRRWSNLRRRLSGAAPAEPVERTRAGVQALISSHGAGAICQHGPQMFTSLGLLIAPRERTLWAADGPPCATPFVEHRL